MSRDHSGFSALHYAVDGGHLNIIAHILNEGVPADDVTEKTLSGWTPLLRTGRLLIRAREHASKIGVLSMTMLYMYVDIVS